MKSSSTPGWFGTSVLVLGCSSSPIATPSMQVSAPGDPPGRVLATVKIRCDRNLVLLPVSVAGSGTFDVVLDTGMPTPGLLLYRSERVDRLPLEFVDAHAVSGAGGSGEGIPTRLARGAKIRIGDLEIADVPLINLRAPDAFAGAIASTGQEGIVGNELLAKYVVRIDRDRGTLELLDPACFAPPSKATVVPLVFHGPSPFVDARVAVGPVDPVPVELAIDLGASHALWLNGGENPAIAAPEGSLSTRLGRGLSGAIEGKVGRVRRFELGGLAFDRVVAMFPEGDQQRPGGQSFRDGFLGGEILSRFRATFDYPSKRLVLEPDSRIDAPFEHDMSGILLDPDANGRPRVTTVLPETPAAEAGVRTGDVLVAVDGVGTRELGPEGIQRAFRQAGAEVVLRLLREGVPSERKVRLRRLV